MSWRLTRAERSALALTVVGVLGIIGLSQSGNHSRDSSPIASSTSTIDDPAHIEMTPEMRRDVTALIQAHGYNCPLAKLSRAQGPDAYGSVVKTWCGPADRDGVYPTLVYRLTVTPSNQWLVEPWPE